MKCETCSDPILNCGDCDSKSIVLTYEEAQDCLSALSFFREKFSDKKGSVVTRKAMMRLEKKLWKLKSPK